MDLAIQQTDDGNQGMFFIEVDGQRAGEMTYTRQDDHTIVIEHTAVGDALKGQGAGKRMVERAVQWAREHEQKIIARCPFARATFDKNPELRDVLAT
ncbi:MAG TPA: GNAT family N-acetyltransferase [Kofleriaceae bacterium]|nr:GNAT family N-acetyltransferase [Kofleriaceae bacterium]